MQAKTQQQAATDQLAQHRQRLDAILDDLDAAFSTSDEQDWQTDWKINWQSDPPAFHAQCERNAQQWHSQKSAREQGLQRIATLALELASLTDLGNKAQADHTRASAALAASEKAVQAMQAQRQTLFNGQPVQQIEAQLASAIASAKAQLATHSQHSNDSKQALSRCSEALAQAKTRLDSQTGETHSSATRLQDWLEQYNARHQADALDAEQLHALLAHPVEWISTERTQLHALDAAVQQAATVLQERSTQRQAHQQQRPPQEDIAASVQPAEHEPEISETVAAQELASTVQASTATASLSEQLQQALHNLIIERNIAHAKATEWHLALAQDDAKRQQSAAMLATIAEQEARHRLWAQLNDLIGAADGKKFRNYAQQYTLDVLLGYANRHLHELSRRYRLQRISDTLALMVVDQDMGDELRSVHSLSGGESFLVSLALALGLASLSSNRVKVESLFIDEGFGSLDAETLRVAMDALDGLQAMGRKVGVISHVQEMTERIATKIMVQRTAGGRSLVGVG